MKRNAPSTTLVTVFCALFVAGIAPALLADGDHTCSYHSVAGKWGYTFTGTFLPSYPSAAVGIFTLDKDGNIADLKNFENDAGSFGEETLSGTYTVNSDCTGSATVFLGDGSTTVFAVVWIDNSNAVRMVSFDAELVITLEGKKLFPKVD